MNINLKLLSLLFITSIASLGQDMYRNYSRENNKWRVTPGVRLGEPLGIDLLFYKGGNCKSRRPWKFDLTVGLDGTLYGDKSKEYGNTQWRSGGWMSSLFLYHDVPWKLLRFISFGVGPMLGNRHREMGANSTIGGWGAAVNTYLINRNIEMKRRTFLNITFMFDLRYTYEVTNSFNLFRPSFTVLVDYLK